MPKEAFHQNIDENLNPEEIIDRRDACRFIKGCVDSDLLKEIANVAYNIVDDKLDDALFANEHFSLDDQLLYATKYFTSNYKKTIKHFKRIFKEGTPSKLAQILAVRKSTKLEKLAQLKGAVDLVKALKKRKYLSGAQILVGGIVWKAIKANSKTARDGQKRFDRAISSEEGVQREAENAYDFLTDYLHRNIPLFPEN